MTTPLGALGIAIALAAALGACSRGPGGPASYDEAMRPVSGLWTLSRWGEVFALCEHAFRHGEKDGQGRAVLALDCLGESSARQGKPERALPYFNKFFKDDRKQLEQVDARARLANNHGVLLIESGKREEGLARLREAFEAVEDEPVNVFSASYASSRAMVVKNLARAYYDRASEPTVRSWVREQGEWYRDYMQVNAPVGRVKVGPAAALEALVAIGRRQANPDTPAWEAQIREWEPLEDAIVSHTPTSARACETSPTGLEVCLRELKPPA
jgi:tetratricopeptide (TPR) repeat protein